MKKTLCTLLVTMFLATTIAAAQEAAKTPVAPVKEPVELSETLKLKVQLSATKRQLLMTQFEEMKAKFDTAVKNLDADFQKASAELTNLVDQAYAEGKVSKGDYDLDVIEAKFVAKEQAKPETTPPPAVK